MVKKLYIDGELSRIGDFNIEIKDEPEKYSIVKREAVYLDWNCISNDECVWYCNHKHYALDKDITDLQTSDEKTIDDFKSLYDFVNQLNQDDAENRYYVVYATDHSGLWLSLDRPTDVWDSGVLAIVKVSGKGKEGCWKKFVRDFKIKQAYFIGDLYDVYISNELGEIIDSAGTVYGNEIYDIAEDILADYGFTIEDIKK